MGARDRYETCYLIKSLKDWEALFKDKLRKKIKVIKKQKS